MTSRMQPMAVQQQHPTVQQPISQVSQTHAPSSGQMSTTNLLSGQMLIRQPSAPQP